MNNKHFDPYFVIGVAILEAVETESIIGKRIRVFDNSYCTRLDKHIDMHQDLYGKDFIIISEPYRKQVHKGTDLRIYGVNYEDMVKVRSQRTGYEYEVMFREDWIVEN